MGSNDLTGAVRGPRGHEDDEAGHDEEHHDGSDHSGDAHEDDGDEDFNELIQKNSELIGSF